LQFVDDLGKSFVTHIGQGASARYPLPRRQLGEGSNKSAVQGYDRRRVSERIKVGKKPKQLHQGVLGTEAATHRLKIHDVRRAGGDRSGIAAAWVSVD
jgi:hypothetical protein